jgi:hypothetical protein
MCEGRRRRIVLDPTSQFVDAARLRHAVQSISARLAGRYGLTVTVWTRFAVRPLLSLMMRVTT